MPADINSNLANWSTTASSNQPDDTDLVVNIPYNFQQIQAVVRKYLATKGADIASAATIDLSTATGNYVHITGSTGPITSLGTVAAGLRYLLVFDSTPTLTHNATSLILPGAANIVAAAGDSAEFVSLGTGNWRCIWYTPNAGLQKKDATLTSLAALGTAANRYAYTTGVDTWAEGTITAAGRALLDDADAANQLVTLGIASATTSAAGIVELATTAEMTTGTDAVRAVTPAAVRGGNYIFAGTNSASSVRVATANGYGSTNTKIRRFVNIRQNIGTDITYADSATLGASFTINTAGVYAISYTDGFVVAGDVGVSLNTTQPTIDISSIADANRITVTTTGSNSYRGACAVTLYLAAADVVRPHTNGLAAGTMPDDVMFTIARVA